MRRSHTFFLRILLDDGEPPALHGQINEPAGSDEWRVSFASALELWGALLERMQARSGSAIPVPPTKGEKP